MAATAPKLTTRRTEQQTTRDPYLWHKLHSLSGILPLGFFLLQHLIANSYALRGPKAYNTVVSVFGYLPFVAVLEIVVIFVPLLYHAVYGFFITAHAQPNVTRYRYGRNWLYLMQRISGVIAFFFIGYHVWNTTLQKYLSEWRGDPHPDQAISYHAIALQFADPTHFVIQMIGILATVFHFTNGVWNFCIRWGVTISARSQRLNAYVCWGLFAVFAGIGLATVLHLHQVGLAYAHAGG